MSLLTSRVVAPLLLVVAAVGAVHVISQRPAAVTPIAWPSVASATAPPGQAIGSAPATSAAPSPNGTPSVPVLPDILKRLNSDTGQTAIGVYGVLQQLEGAVGRNIESLLRGLEAGR